MKTYIRSSACISPQNTFGSDPARTGLSHVIEYTGTRLKAIEPDYKEYIDLKSLRRMSHSIKMGLAAALECLKQGTTAMPGAIITGTAYGCLEDTVTFLTKIIQQEEELLPPTPFIQSTHNTVASQIALMLQCHQYNNTFVHKGISFESALLDGILLLKEHEADNILVGGTDEMTDTSFTILNRLGLYKRLPVSNLDLYSTKSKGSIGGEGAAFFLLTDKAAKNNLAELTAMKTFYKPTGFGDIKMQVMQFLAQHSLSTNDIDVVLTGKNGDTRNDEIYEQLNTSLFHDTAFANYKHLCGEYPTSVAFALWLASTSIKNELVPKSAIEKKKDHIGPKRILIYNHYQGIYHSLILVSAV